jgi:hypothetical protein
MPATYFIGSPFIPGTIGSPRGFFKKFLMRLGQDISCTRAVWRLRAPVAPALKPLQRFFEETLFGQVSARPRR